jgi:hypothetical protein
MERLANELLQKSVEKRTPCTRTQTLVKDDVLWKELQQELRKSKAVSPIAIQVITRQFMEKHQTTIDEELNRQEQEWHKNNRRSSNPDQVRQSSMKYIAERSMNIRRALSLGKDFGSPDIANAAKSSSSPASHRCSNFQRDSLNHQSVNLINWMNTMSTVRLSESLGSCNVRERLIPSRMNPCDKAHRSAEDVYDALDTATKLHSLETIKLECCQLTSSLNSHLECDNESMCSGDGMSSDDDLLVMFPSRPRKKSASKLHMSRTA